MNKIEFAKAIIEVMNIDGFDHIKIGTLNWEKPLYDYIIAIRRKAGLRPVEVSNEPH